MGQHCSTIRCWSCCLARLRICRRLRSSRHVVGRWDWRQHRRLQKPRRKLRRRQIRSRAKQQLQQRIVEQCWPIRREAIGRHRRWSGGSGEPGERPDRDFRHGDGTAEWRSRWQWSSVSARAFEPVADRCRPCRTGQRDATSHRVTHKHLSRLTPWLFTESRRSFVQDFVCDDRRSQDESRPATRATTTRRSDR